MSEQTKDQQHLSLEKFKAWLEGVEEMQPDDWCPNPVQWARIRDKISLIKEGPAVAPAPTYRAPQVPIYPPAYDPAAPLSLQTTESAFDSGYIQPPVRQPTGIEPPVYSRPRGPAGGFSGDGDMSNPVQTPTIDSSSGYVSTFAG